LGFLAPYWSFFLFPPPPVDRQPLFFSPVDRLFRPPPLLPLFGFLSFSGTKRVSLFPLQDAVWVFSTSFQVLKKGFFFSLFFPPPPAVFNLSRRPGRTIHSFFIFLFSPFPPPRGSSFSFPPEGPLFFPSFIVGGGFFLFPPLGRISSPPSEVWCFLFHFEFFLRNFRLEVGFTSPPVFWI